jgi:gamma-glutamylcyclotransferase (GGCT)/AIG2-like uncharacterized protein YtfP
MPHDSTTLPFFVYGSLLRGHQYHRLIGGGTLSVRAAVLPEAAMYDAGSYPYVLLGGAGGVRGELVDVRPEEYAGVLGVLDRLEGCLGPGHPANDYDRLARSVVTDSGSSVLAWVYVASPAREREVRAMPRVPGGDWAAYTAASR